MDKADAAAALRKWLDETEVQERAHYTGFDKGIRFGIIAIGWLFLGGALVAGSMAAPGLLVSAVLCGVWASVMRSRATQRMQFRHLLNALRRQAE